MRDVLVVEDDESLGRVVAAALRAAGHDVRVAGDVDAAIAEVRDRAPDVLCVDIDLPGRTGWALLDELESLGLAGARVIIATAGDSSTVATRANGAAFVLPKPFPVESLLRLVAGEELPEI